MRSFHVFIFNKKTVCVIFVYSGDHFSRLGENQPGASQQKSPTVHTSLPQGGADISVLSSTNPKQATSVDESKMQEILADAEVRAILMDSQIQTLFELLRRDPNEGQRLVDMIHFESLTLFLYINMNVCL